MWLHQQIRREFPGLRLPKPPENDLCPVQQYFESLSVDSLVCNCFLLETFCLEKDPTLFREFVRKRNALFPEENGLAKIKTFFSDTPLPQKKELEGIQAKAVHLSRFEKAMTADYSLFAESLLDFACAMTIHLKKAETQLKELEQLYAAVSLKHQQLTQAFAQLSTLMRKLNFAKTQFPGFEESQINLDMVLVKLQRGFEIVGWLSRQGQPTTAQGG